MNSKQDRVEIAIDNLLTRLKRDLMLLRSMEMVLVIGKLVKVKPDSISFENRNN